MINENEIILDDIDLAVIMKALRTRELRADITEMERTQIRMTMEKIANRIR